VKLKLDEHFGHSTAKLFHESGHDVETVRSQQLRGAPDEDLIAACQAEHRCLITLDSDFGNPFIFKPWEYSGIAVLRLPSKPSHQDLALVCRTLIRALEREEIVGKLWTVQRGRVREYRPDLPDDEMPD